MVNITRFVKAPKNIKELHYLKRKYYHLIIRVVSIYNRLVSIFNPQKINLSGLKELDEIRQRSFKRTDISDHLVRLFEESLDIRPKLIVELGVGPGESSFVLENISRIYEANLVSIDRNSKTVGLDSPHRFFINMDDIEFAKNFKNWCHGKNIEPLIDILFIDTSHKYLHTKDEIEYWFKFLSDRAKVFFHDTNVEAVYWREDGSVGVTYTHEPRGVMRAIEEFLGASFNEKEKFLDIRNGWKIKHNPLCNGFTILNKI